MADWWKKSTVYQIYPKSFKDSNGDGIGDIGGIIEKLDYLKDLGIDVIWITPIYVSPQNDNGYDIADYYNIDPLFGTMEEFEELLKEIHKRDLKLIMDMVVNHTSTEHKWFKEALKGKDNPYHDFYIWKKGEKDIPPTNWKSKFGGSAWKYVQKLDEYYLHLFDVTQADLNWENPTLRKEIYKMMRFWMDKGVDGFRLDVVNLLSKDQRFLNDTLEDSNHDGRKFYTDGPKIHEYLREMNEEVFSKYEDTMTVGEMSSTTIDNCVKYTKPSRKELTMTFSFHHLKVDYLNGEKWSLMSFDFNKLKEILFNWQVGMEEGCGWNALFWCNHDQPRVLSRFGDDLNFHEKSGKMLGTAIHLMRGTPYIYQGEEIGMTNPKFESIDDYRDVESINAYNELKNKGCCEKEILNILKEKSRDNSRTPVQWDESENSGFTKGISWIDLSKNYKEINVDNNIKDKDSIFNYYKKLINLRRTYEIISNGKIKPILKNDKNILAYERILNNNKLIVFCNFYGNEANISLKEYDLKSSEILISNYGDFEVKTYIKLRPYECFALYIKNE
ncbi:alpha,alpha-phosphotrehalase [Eubacterium multiforme]|uniref:Alpha,alpha-phosphotrehalase n=1 Tax=Eubacterium multiforme TaxID=83339 RepID=A0ABT9UXI8_9FIRM|nr:alpha,alpha-phosphotrehalase [Eubacterium multiforme]MDQ0151040.1 trehalose-6-phosphate hydrolase [Eubacterium multiforme]